MKKQLLLAAVAFFLSMGTLFAQAPNLMNYQGVARDAAGQALSGQAISLRIQIRQNSTSGTVQYRETHNVTTNSYGLYNVQVGAGTNKTNTLASVNWGNGTKYMQVQIDPNGGTSWTTVGTTQLLSAPYALYAKEVAPKQKIIFECRGLSQNVTITTGNNSSNTPLKMYESYDDGGNNYDTATGEFTAPVDGYYHFEATINFNALTVAPNGSDYIVLAFDKNGSNSIRKYVTPSSTGQFGTQLSMDIKLVQGDKIDLYLFHNTGGDLIVDMNNNESRFSGYKID